MHAHHSTTCLHAHPNRTWARTLGRCGRFNPVAGESQGQLNYWTCPRLYSPDSPPPVGIPPSPYGDPAKICPVSPCPTLVSSALVGVPTYLTPGHLQPLCTHMSDSQGNGRIVVVAGYPSSPFVWAPFTRPFVRPRTAIPFTTYKSPLGNTGDCAAVHEQDTGHSGR